MNKCPKCNTTIDDNQTSCPKCGKVLKIKCPKCGKLNDKAVCSACKTKLLIRCKDCSQIVPVSQKKCKCGTSVPYSLIAKTAKLKEFAIICIEFCNLTKLEYSLGGETIYTEFKKSLIKYINDEAKKNNCGCYELDDEVISIDLSQKNTLGESCDKAIEISLNLTSFFEKLNKKLKEQKDITLQVKIGVSTKLITERRLSSREERAIKPTQDIDIITNMQVFKYTKSYYDYEPLLSTFINNQVITFYRLLTRNYLLAEEKEEAGSISEIPDYNDTEEDNDFSLLQFPELRKNLRSVKCFDVHKEVEKILLSSKNGIFINVMGHEDLGRLQNVNVDKLIEKFKSVNWIQCPCIEDVKYYPFGYIRKFIKSVMNLPSFDIDKQQVNYFIVNKLNSMLGADCIELQTLITMEESKPRNIDELRYKVFKQVGEFIIAATAKTSMALVINDIEYIDKGSLDCINYLIENDIINSKFSIIASSSIDFQLSEKLPKLMVKENYFEILTKRNSKEEIQNYLRDISRSFARSFFFEQIVQYSRGSVFYVKNAIDYLLENNIVKYKLAKLDIISSETPHISCSSNDIISQRLKKIIDTEVIGQLYLKLLLLGPRVSVNMMKYLQKSSLTKEIKALETMGYISIVNKMIIVKNYNIFHKLTFAIIDNKKLKKASSELLKVLPVDGNTVDPTVARLLECADEKKLACNLWNTLAHRSLLIGDVCGFKDCSLKFLDELEFASIENSNTEESINVDKINEVKFDIYEQLGKLLYEFYPEDAYDFLKEVIKNADKQNDFEKLVRTSSLMVHSCNLSGNYTGVLDSLKQIIIKTPQEQLDIESKEFNIKFYLLNFIKVQALFNLGKIQECRELASELIDDLNKIKQIPFVMEQVNPQMINTIIRDVTILIIKSKIIQLDTHVEEDLTAITYEHPEFKSMANILLLSYKALLGANTNIKNQLTNIYKNSDDFEEKLYSAIGKIICDIQSNDWQEVIKTAYYVNSIAKEYKEYQLLYLLNLFIAMAYKHIFNATRSREVIEDILKSSANKNILNIMLFNWYLIAKMELEQNKPDIALNIINKANLILEKNNKSGKIFLVYFKYLQGLIFIKLGSVENAQSCIENSYNTSKSVNEKYLQTTTVQLLLHLLQSPNNPTKNINEKIETLTQNLNELKSKILTSAPIT